jgi:putative ABC transport system ATP-binding protein
MIEIIDLVVRFNAGLPTETTPLRGLSLRIDTGQFVNVIGSNGAGKSTLLNAVSGDVPAASGRIVIDGINVTATSPSTRAEHVARVFQDPLVGTCEQLTVEENLALASARGSRRSLRPASNAQSRERFAAALAELGLGIERKLRDPLASLSGGQRQVVSLLMATMAPSKLLLLDEHTAALDPKTAAFVTAMSERIARQSRLTVLMVTHSMQQALAVGDRTVMLHGGRIIFDVAGEARKGLTVQDLLRQFERTQGTALTDDSLILGT